MAWRIQDSVIRGEIDNRRKGFVRGRLWLDGVAEPLVLELQGDACPDLAGCLLSFENPGETIPVRQDGRLHPRQRGTIGDLTASRKVRVLDVPIEEFTRLRRAGLPAPEHMANCLYLEWFSDANGRVVIESTDYQLHISPPAWTLSPAENEQRAKDAAAGFGGFLQKLSDAADELDVDEINRLCAEAADEPLEPDPATEGVDWVRAVLGDLQHPLVKRAFDSCMALWYKADALESAQQEDADLSRLISEFQITGAKLAGALDSLAYGREYHDGPFTVACLKRALSHLHAAQAALEKVAPKSLLPADVLARARTELFEIRAEILRLMGEFRRQP